MFSIQSPEPFNFINSEQWPNWVRRFERYGLASKLSEEDEKNRVNTLMCLLGNKADDILSSFQLSNAESENYNVVKTKFDTYFAVRKNVIYERAVFNKRIQLPGKTVDEFILSLHCLAEPGNYGALKDEMVRDRLVVGLSEKHLSEHLQLDANLTLTKAVEKARNFELVKKQQSIIRNLEEIRNQIEAIKGKRKVQNSWRKERKNCLWCGSNTAHDRSKCPANNARCFKCSKLGHFTTVCRNRAVKAIERKPNVEYSLRDEPCSSRENNYFWRTVSK